MTYKQLLSLKHYSLTLKKSFENEIVDNIDFADYGYVNYMIFYLSKIISVYDEILFFIEKHHFKIINEDEPIDDTFNDDDEDIDLKNILLTFTDDVDSTLPHLDKKLPNILIDFVSLYHENKKIMDNKIKELFKDLPKYKIINKEFIQMNENEINKMDLENEIYSFEISYQINNWEDYYNKLVELINNEDYINLLKHLGLESYEEY
jgi:hypothetical protein